MGAGLAAAGALTGLAAAGLGAATLRPDDVVAALTGLFSLVDSLLGASLTLPEGPNHIHKDESCVEKSKVKTLQKTPNTWGRTRNLPFGNWNVPLAAPVVIERLSWLVRAALNSSFQRVSMYLEAEQERRVSSEEGSQLRHSQRHVHLLLKTRTRDASTVRVLDDCFL